MTTPKHKSKGLKDLKIITIDDAKRQDNKELINSPKSLEACKREGISPKELIHRPYSEFSNTVLRPEIAQMRYDYYENKRIELIKTIERERENIIQQLEENDLKRNSIRSSCDFRHDANNHDFMVQSTNFTSRNQNWNPL